MAVTQQEIALHQLKGNDLRGFINVLTPLASCTDQEVSALAKEKLKEFIPQLKLFEESPIKKIL